MRWQQWVLVSLFALSALHNLVTALGGMPHTAPKPAAAVAGTTAAQKNAWRVVALLSVQGLMIWMVTTL